MAWCSPFAVVPISLVYFAGAVFVFKVFILQLILWFRFFSLCTPFSFHFFFSLQLCCRLKGLHFAASLPQTILQLTLFSATGHFAALQLPGRFLFAATLQPTLLQTESRKVQRSCKMSG